MKENVTVVNVNTATTKEDILKSIENLSLEEQKEIRECLLKYCELDTYAMVKIWEALNEVTEKIG